MALESATSISDLVATNPASTDTKKQGDDHLRLIKAALQYCFPNASKPYYIPTSKAKSTNYTVLEADENCVIVCDTTTAFTLTLPTLDTDNAGWCCHVLKTTTDVNPVFIAPPSGTINGYTKVRRAIPYIKTKVLWTGSIFVAERASGVPIGSRIPYHGSTLPPGYLWPDGSTFTAVDYVELNTVLGGNTKPDTRGRTGIGKDNMGGTSANRITAAGCGMDGDVLGTVGGTETHTLTVAQMPAHAHGGVTSNPTTSPTLNAVTLSLSANASSGTSINTPLLITSPNLPNHVHSIASEGGGTAHNNVQPSFVQNELLVTE